MESNEGWRGTYVGRRVRTHQTLYDEMMSSFKDLFQSTPTWFQEISMELYEEYRQYPPIDFFRFFIILSVVPLTLLTLWSAVVFVMVWTGISGVGLTVTLLSLFATFLTIINSTIWITMITCEYLLTLFRDLDQNKDIVVQSASRNAEESTTTAATGDPEEILATTSTILDDPTAFTSTALNI
ncbi:13143_t:CDS:2 [Funneliformis geosporum]|uniref:6587_t:CDS:1 n=1 Tax=Funneliformis geosporum TaxID=1117311 RepID=A0A9W4SCK0_9GLOM|nr:6587_t:CDS:2 [Funneliformis geosporum]CAI2162553.1 13143_t:CDS:2 [Funneliformis geosporum]